VPRGSREKIELQRLLADLALQLGHPLGGWLGVPAAGAPPGLPVAHDPGSRPGD
jgi:hypothetical protein